MAVVGRRGVAHNSDSQTARKTPLRLATPNGVLLTDECIQIQNKKRRITLISKYSVPNEYKLSMDFVIHILNAVVKPQRCHGVQNRRQEISEKFPNLIKFKIEIPGISAVRN